MNFVAGMMVFHNQLGAGKLLQVDEEGEAATIAFLAYAPWVKVELRSVKICKMTEKWEEVQKIFKEASL